MHEATKPFLPYCALLFDIDQFLAPLPPGRILPATGVQRNFTFISLPQLWDRSIVDFN